VRPGLPAGGLDGLRLLHGAPCRALLQHAEDHHLRRLQRDPAQHHRQGDAGALKGDAMNFDLSQEQQLLADTIKRFITNDYSFDARAKIVATPRGWSDEVWSALAEMGLCGLPFPAEYDGFGGSAVDVMIVMESIGEGLLVEPYLATVGLGGQFV